MSANRREDTGGPDQVRTDADWQRQARGVAGRTWRRFGGGLPFEDRDDCLGETLAAAVAIGPRLEGLPPGGRAAYAEVVLGRAVRDFLRREQEARRRTVALEGLRTDDGERREWPASSDTQAEAIGHLDLAEQVSDGRLAAAIRSLKPGERKILHTHFVLGLSDAETGAEMGLSPNAVQKRRKALLTRLAAVLCGREARRERDS